MVQTPTPSHLFFLALLLLSSIQGRKCLVRAIRHHKPKTIPLPRVFSLPLLPLDSIRNHQNQNYTARAISRLAADRARINFINSKLGNTLFNSSDQLNMELDANSDSLPISYVGRDGYVVPIGVDQPKKKFNLLVDTGSDITWFKCSPCTALECEGQRFDPSHSFSYKPLSANSAECLALNESHRLELGPSDTCNYKNGYGDGSQSQGELATATLFFQESAHFEDVAIGCDNSTNTNHYDGILGLGWGESISLISEINANSFSYCLVDPDSQSSSTLDFNLDPPSNSVIVPMSKQGYGYSVEITGITVGEDEIPVTQDGGGSGGGIIVDSGTWLTYLNDQVYGSVINAFKNKTQNLKAYENRYSQTCYDVSSSASTSASLNGIPISFKFSDGKTLPLETKNYLIPDDNPNKLCLAFLSIDKMTSSDARGSPIMGHTLQRGMRITFDIHNQLIGFSPNKC